MERKFPNLLARFAEDCQTVAGSSSSTTDGETVDDDSLSITQPKVSKFHIDTSRIERVPVHEQNDELQNLNLMVYNQEAFEQGVLAQVDEIIETEEKDRARRQLTKELIAIDDDIAGCQSELEKIEKLLSSVQNSSSKEVKHRVISIQSQQRNVKSRLQTLNVRRQMTVNKLDALSNEQHMQCTEQGNEIGTTFSDMDSCDAIRRGEMTPFGTVLTTSQETGSKMKPKQGFDSMNMQQPQRNVNQNAALKRKHSSVIKSRDRKAEKSQTAGSDVEWKPDGVSDESEYYTSDDETVAKKNVKAKRSAGEIDGFCDDDFRVTGRVKLQRSQRNELSIIDDGTEELYLQRIRAYNKQEIEKQKFRSVDETSSGSDMEVDGGFRVPACVWNKLHRYQKTGVRWLWELHCQQAGGILGDEMGLGKTIQIIAFLAGLSYSKLQDSSFRSSYAGLGPVLIVCPATVMHQWVKEFHQWWPLFRVAILHSTGTYNTSEHEMIRSVVRSRGVLITAFSTVVLQQDLLLGVNWHYVILDEGHKIRNPDAQVTIACKQFQTCHKLILSGSPIQNNLKELWSLFDFIFPGKLGTLPDFMQNFSVPIVQGGYANATEIQVLTAYKCACVLRDTISPYLLRRMKADVKVNLQLPDKNEQILFCRLTNEQRQVYQEYLDSKECRLILDGKYMVFPGLITLRKICNHPDLSTGGPKFFGDLGNTSSDDTESDEYGYWKRSGKMIVVESLLKLWKKQDHKVLLFSQSRQMSDVLEAFVKQRNYCYIRMDGGTPIGLRQPLVTRFNTDPSIFLFLLTTRVGGLGLNLTGADRVIIFDPDWNPSTDTQARERAWRIGQTKPVTIYRLLTSGTIEEKIYHRQIFKQFLTNRVLKDPKQQRFFKSNDLHELFTLRDDGLDGGTETSALFAGTNSDVKLQKRRKNTKDCADTKQTPKKRKNRFDYLKEKAQEFGVADECDKGEGDSDDERVSQLRELAKRLSQNISQRKANANQAAAKPVSQQEPIMEQKVDSCISDLPSVIEKTNTIGSLTSTKSVVEALSSTVAQSGSTTDKKPNKQHKKHSRHKHRAVVDGEKISNVDRVRQYNPAADVQESDSAANQDDYVLRKLMKKSGVHSAMLHDNIMQSCNPDYMLVEAEAERVARDAARALRQSRQRCLSSQQPGVPTWTGHHGAEPAARPRFGRKKNPTLVVENTKADTANKKKPPKPVDECFLFDGNSLIRRSSSASLTSSAELMADLRSKQSASNPSGVEANSDGQVPQSWVNPAEDHMELIDDIRSFVAFGAAVDGQATTNEILEKFRARIPAETTARFKSMLKQVCSFYKSDGVGIWKLKDEYR